MDLKLFFTVEYHKKGKDFSWEIPQEEECWKGFAAAVSGLWPGVKVPAAGGLSFRIYGKGTELLTRKPLLINGVAAHHRILKPGDRITLGSFRLIYRATELIESVQSEPAPAKKLESSFSRKQSKTKSPAPPAEKTKEELPIKPSPKQAPEGFEIPALKEEAPRRRRERKKQIQVSEQSVKKESRRKVEPKMGETKRSEPVSEGTEQKVLPVDKDKPELLIPEVLLEKTPPTIESSSAETEFPAPQVTVEFDSPAAESPEPGAEVSIAETSPPLPQDTPLPAEAADRPESPVIEKAPPVVDAGPSAPQDTPPPLDVESLPEPPPTVEVESPPVESPAADTEISAPSEVLEQEDKPAPLPVVLPENIEKMVKPSFPEVGKENPGKLEPPEKEEKPKAPKAPKPVKKTAPKKRPKPRKPKPPRPPLLERLKIRETLTGLKSRTISVFTGGSRRIRRTVGQTAEKWADYQNKQQLRRQENKAKREEVRKKQQAEREDVRKKQQAERQRKRAEQDENRKKRAEARKQRRKPVPGPVVKPSPEPKPAQVKPERKKTVKPPKAVKPSRVPREKKKRNPLVLPLPSRKTVQKFLRSALVAGAAAVVVAVVIIAVPRLAARRPVETVSPRSGNTAAIVTGEDGVDSEDLALPEVFSNTIPESPGPAEETEELYFHEGPPSLYNGGALSNGPAGESAYRPSAHVSGHVPVIEGTASVAAVPPVESRPGESTPAGAMAVETTPSEELDIVIIPPGAAIPEFDLDMLFIHAHPDDEALDFGCLMSLADAGGLKTGLVIFTDGEMGLDLYPQRPVTGIYPDHSMEGEELAAVRSLEVARAADVLGVDLLIRFGLKNHPYNGKADELPPEEILSIWGGSDQLEETILEIIEKTRPETVVAPDVPGRAAEHFEHEAVGFLSSRIMLSLAPEAAGAPLRFISCIDPRQVHLYPEASLVESNLRVKNGKPEGAKSTLREVQLSALAMHKTQNDAAVVGTGFLPTYPAEYYQIQFWRSDQSWDEWIASLVP